MTCNFIKKETLAQVFSFEFYVVFKNTFLQNTSRRLHFYTTIQQNFVLMILVLPL